MVVIHASKLEPGWNGVEGLEPAFEGVLDQILRVIGIVGQPHRLPVQCIDGGHGELFKSGALGCHGLARSG